MESQGAGMQSETQIEKGERESEKERKTRGERKIEGNLLASLLGCSYRSCLGDHPQILSQGRGGSGSRHRVLVVAVGCSRSRCDCTG